jgi:hypothetical protein
MTRYAEEDWEDHEDFGSQEYRRKEIEKELIAESIDLIGFVDALFKYSGQIGYSILASDIPAEVLQDLGLQYGLLKQVVVHRPCMGGCACDDDYTAEQFKIGVPCIRRVHLPEKDVCSNCGQEGVVKLCLKCVLPKIPTPNPT